MKTIKTIVTVTSSRQITITLPSGISPGKHEVLLVIDENSLTDKGDNTKRSLKLNVGQWKNWPSESNFRREDIYDDRI
jgi:hypothetical protein